MSYLKDLKKTEDKKPIEKTVIQKNQNSEKIKQVLNKKTNIKNNEISANTNPSALLNYIKFSYTFLTGKSSTNKTRKVMVKEVREALLKK